MNTKRIAKCNRNNLIFFSVLHFIVWLITYSLYGWWGIFLGFLINCIIDMGVLIAWILHEKNQLSQKAVIRQRNSLNVEALINPQKEKFYSFYSHLLNPFNVCTRAIVRLLTKVVGQ